MLKNNLLRRAALKLFIPHCKKTFSANNNRYLKFGYRSLPQHKGCHIVAWDELCPKEVIP